MCAEIEVFSELHLFIILSLVPEWELAHHWRGCYSCQYSIHFVHIAGECLGKINENSNHVENFSTAAKVQPAQYSRSFNYPLKRRLNLFEWWLVRYCSLILRMRCGVLYNRVRYCTVLVVGQCLKIRDTLFFRTTGRHSPMQKLWMRIMLICTNYVFTHADQKQTSRFPYAYRGDFNVRTPKHATNLLLCPAWMKILADVGWN